MFQKNRIYPIILIVAMFVVWQLRKSGQAEFVSISGTTMGTTYNIKYFVVEGTNYKIQIDSILVNFNHSLSTYEEESEISTFNKQSTFTFIQPYFYTVLQKSKEIYESTGKAFDPSVYPLVSAWGFGPEGRNIPDSSQVDSLLTYVGFSKIEFDKQMVTKSIPGIKLDFSAIAKGYGVDVIGNYFNGLNVTNYFIEIGGEVKCKGLNKGNKWRVGIEDPRFDKQGKEISAIAELSDKSMATSGNYRNFYELDGVKYAHTIDPKTGYPVKHSLLSASVFAPSCMVADAYATAFMVMGLEAAKELSGSIIGLDVFLVYSDSAGNLKTFTSKGMEDQIRLIGF